jgi:hypothetical protein
MIKWKRILMLKKGLEQNLLMLENHGNSLFTYLLIALFPSKTT